MARTALSKVVPTGSYPTLPLSAGAATITLTAADTVNQNSVPWGNAHRLLVIAQNTGASARTVTITSAADGLGRTGDISAYSIAAGGVAVLGPFERPGWAQADASLYLEANNAEVKFAIVPV